MKNKTGKPFCSETSRRGFIKGVLAAGIAPAVVPGIQSSVSVGSVCAPYAQMRLE